MKLFGFTFYKRPQPPSIKEEIARQLYTSQMQRLEFKASAEHSAAMVTMLEQRIHRLTGDLNKVDA